MSKAPAKGDKTRALYALHWMPKLKPAARTVGAWLVWHTNAATGRCDPGQARLRAETGLSARTIQYAVDDLLRAGVVRRELRGNESSSYQIDWRYLGEISRAYEAKAIAGEAVVSPLEHTKRGRNSLREGGASHCVSGAQVIASKLSEENSRNKPVFRVGPISKKTGDVDSTDDAMARKLLGMGEDNAFLAALDREAKRGRLFSEADANLMYARLETICDAGDGHGKGDPLTGRAYRLLETELMRRAGE